MRSNGTTFHVNRRSHRCRPVPSPTGGPLPLRSVRPSVRPSVQGGVLPLNKPKQNVSGQPPFQTAGDDVSDGVCVRFVTVEHSSRWTVSVSGQTSTLPGCALQIQASLAQIVCPVLSSVRCSIGTFDPFGNLHIHLYHRMAEQAKKEMKHILDLSKAERRLFLHSFDTLMSDCDGVLWNFTGPIPGVDKALQLLRTDGKKLAFISNNGMRTMEEYQKKFHSLGIDALEEEIVHPALTTVHYLKSIRMRDAVYCIGTEVFKDYLRKAGFKVLDGPKERFPDSREANQVRVYSDYFEQHGPKVGAVVIDIDVNLSLQHLMKAKCYLERDPNCVFIAGATDYIIPLDSSMDVIGPGYFIDILERTTGRKALILGKPGKALAQVVLEQFQITEPKRVLFVGDMMPQDMGFGTECGFQKLLMLSGGTPKDALLAQTDPNQLPNYYADSFADFIELYNETMHVEE